VNLAHVAILIEDNTRGKNTPNLSKR